MATAKGPMHLLKRFVNEIPEVAGSSLMALIGVGLMVAGVRNYYARDLDNRRYREEYTVIRHDDPKVAKLRKDYLADKK